MSRSVLREKEVAHALGCSASSLRKYRYGERGAPVGCDSPPPVVCEDGKRPVYERAALLDWVERNNVKLRVEL